jgi:hypothetical protein
VDARTAAEFDGSRVRLSHEPATLAELSLGAWQVTLDVASVPKLSNGNQWPWFCRPLHSIT